MKAEFARSRRAGLQDLCAKCSLGGASRIRVLFISASSIFVRFLLSPRFALSERFN